MSGSMSGELGKPTGPPAGSGRRVWWCVLVSAGAVYLLTAQHGPAWQDSGVFQWRMRTLDLGGAGGLALAHPLLIVLGRLAGAVPLGSLAFRFNALSAVAAAVAAANLALLVRRLSPRVPAAGVFAAGAFALAHSVWWLATIAESHALLAALLSAELLVLAELLRRPTTAAAAALGLLNGLGLATHNLALLALPAYALAVVLLAARGRLRRSAVAVFAAGWAVGASLWIALVIGLALRAGVSAALGSALFGAEWKGAVLGGSARSAARGLGYVLYNFPNLALPLAALGLWRARRRVGAGLAGALAWVLGAHFLFAVRYAVPDQFMFFVPFYLVVSLLAGLGLAEVWGRRKLVRIAAVASLGLGPAGYALAPAVVGAVDLRLPGSARRLPYRDHARYWLTPWKLGEDSAGKFAAEAIDQLGRRPEPTILFADTTSYPPLRWAAEEQGLPAGMRLVGGGARRLRRRLEEDPRGFWADVRREGASVWVVSNVPGYCPAGLGPFVQPEPTGVLYRVRAPGTLPGP